MTTRTSLLSIIAVCALGVLSLLGGWIIVYGDGFYASLSKRPANYIFVSGMPALFMALLQYLLSALAFTWILRLRLAPIHSSLIAFSLVFAPPLLYILLW